MEVSEENPIRLKLYALSRMFEEAFILDSCDIKPAMDLGRFKWLAGFGKKRVLSAFEAENVLREIDSFINVGQWCFGVLSYDLRYAVEKLPDQCRPLHHTPLALLVQPEWVVGCRHDGELIYHGINNEELEALLNKLPSQSSLQTDNICFRHLTDKETYVHQVNAIRDEIAKGNVYEMNYCIQLEANWPEHGDDLNLHLNRIKSNPTPFSAYVKYAENRLLCSSPERYLMKDGNHIYSQPIKGTMARGTTEDEDRRRSELLRSDEKFRAENVMIVDLVRNDLAKISQTGSVIVDELFGVYPFAYVLQLISTVSADLKPNISFSDLIRSSFPMGSMTGAPKVAAMQFIENFETYKRHWYSGSVFYIDPEGNMDSNVIIRSLQIDLAEQKATYGVGGAITFDSGAEEEYEECKDKIKGISGALS